MKKYLAWLLLFTLVVVNMSCWSNNVGSSTSTPNNLTLGDFFVKYTNPILKSTNTKMADKPATVTKQDQQLEFFVPDDITIGAINMRLYADNKCSDKPLTVAIGQDNVPKQLNGGSLYRTASDAMYKICNSVKGGCAFVNKNIHSIQIVYYPQGQSEFLGTCSNLRGNDSKTQVQAHDGSACISGDDCNLNNGYTDVVSNNSSSTFLYLYAYNLGTWPIGVCAISKDTGAITACFDPLTINGLNNGITGLTTSVDGKTLYISYLSGDTHSKILACDISHGISNVTCWSPWLSQFIGGYNGLAISASDSHLYAVSPGVNNSVWSCPLVSALVSGGGQVGQCKPIITSITAAGSIYYYANHIYLTQNNGVFPDYVLSCSTKNGSLPNGCSPEMSGPVSQQSEGIAIYGNYAYVATEGNGFVCKYNRLNGSISNCSPLGLSFNSVTTFGGYVYLQNSRQNIQACAINNDGSLNCQSPVFVRYSSSFYPIAISSLPIKGTP